MTNRCNFSSNFAASCATAAVNRPASPSQINAAVERVLRELHPDMARHRVLNTVEAATFLNFSVPHFRRLYRSGGVPAPMQLSTRKLGWKAGDLIDWVAARESRPVTSHSRSEI
jgi:predicted DNA-binding transcriptional regulator AlpA